MNSVSNECLFSRSGDTATQSQTASIIKSLHHISLKNPHVSPINNLPFKYADFKTRSDKYFTTIGLHKGNWKF